MPSTTLRPRVGCCWVSLVWACLMTFGGSGLGSGLGSLGFAGLGGLSVLRLFPVKTTSRRCSSGVDYLGPFASVRSDSIRPGCTASHDS